MKTVRVDFSKVGDFFMFPEHEFEIDFETKIVLCDCYFEACERADDYRKCLRESCVTSYGYFNYERYDQLNDELAFEDDGYPDHSFRCIHNPNKDRTLVFSRNYY